jgi:hypothetical protein
MLGPPAPPTPGVIRGLCITSLPSTVLHEAHSSRARLHHHWMKCLASGVVELPAYSSEVIPVLSTCTVPVGPLVEQVHHAASVRGDSRFWPLNCCSRLEDVWRVPVRGTGPRSRESVRCPRLASPAPRGHTSSSASRDVSPLTSLDGCQHCAALSPVPMK